MFFHRRLRKATRSNRVHAITPAPAKNRILRSLDVRSVSSDAVVHAVQPPPQSTPSSCPFWTPSVQEARALRAPGRKMQEPPRAKYPGAHFVQASPRYPALHWQYPLTTPRHTPRPAQGKPLDTGQDTVDPGQSPGHRFGDVESQRVPRQASPVSHTPFPQTGRRATATPATHG